MIDLYFTGPEKQIEFDFMKPELPIKEVVVYFQYDRTTHQMLVPVEHGIVHLDLNKWFLSMYGGNDECSIRIQSFKANR